MVTIRTWLGQASLALETAGVDTPRLDSQVLLASALGKDRTWILAHGEDALDPAVTGKAAAMLARREAREPLSYITGRREFFGRSYLVGPGVLVPRQETETVAEAALSVCPYEGRVLDVGCGSGCLLLTILAEKPEAAGLGLDISATALKWAARNALQLGVSADLRQSDGFAALTPDDGLFDLIVSNPPYIKRGEAVQPEVVKFEPEAALYADEDGMALYRLLAEEGQEWLRSGGHMVVEIGDGRWPDIEDLFAEHGWEIVETRRDLASMPRALVVRTDWNEF